MPYQDYHFHAGANGSLLKLASHSTAHCLLGCGIGEFIGLVIGVSLGIGPWYTMALAG